MTLLRRFIIFICCILSNIEILTAKELENAQVLVNDVLFNVISESEALQELVDRGEEIKTSLIKNIMDSRTSREPCEEDLYKNEELKKLHLVFFASLELANQGARIAIDQSLNRSAMYSFVPGVGYLAVHSIWKVAKYTAMSLAVHNPLPFFVFVGESTVKYGGVYGAWFILKSGIEKNIRKNFDFSENKELMNYYKLDNIKESIEMYENDTYFQHSKEQLVAKLLPMIEQKIGIFVDENMSFQELGKHAFALSELGVLYLMSTGLLEEEKN